MSRPHTTMVVLGEGNDELGPPRHMAALSAVPHQSQGALEILMRRAFFHVLHPGQDWYPGLDDGVGVLEAPPIRSRTARVEVLMDPAQLASVVLGALKPANGVPADYVVLAKDADAGSAPFDGLVERLREVSPEFAKRIIKVVPRPELQAWLTTKRGVERAYDRQHCTVPEPQQLALAQDPKKELRRLVDTFGGTLGWSQLAKIATFVKLDEIAGFPQNGWAEMLEALKLQIGQT